MWLGAKRGYLTDWVTQQWVRATGRRIQLKDYPWLAGPVGQTTGIGHNFFEQLAQHENLSMEPGVGLLADFRMLASEQCQPSAVSASVVHFYEHTADYEMDAWSEWAGAFKPFGWLLARIFSHRLQQLNVPLSGLDTSKGIASRVISLVDRAAGSVRYTAWVRQLLGSERVLYAGSYSVCKVPDHGSTCVKVVFPLPNGNAIVIMYPQSFPDGSFRLTSSGKGFGAPGFYFTVHSEDCIWARPVRSMRETITVYPTAAHEVRADHVLTIWGFVFLRLHYRLRRFSKEATD